MCLMCYRYLTFSRKKELHKTLISKIRRITGSHLLLFVALFVITRASQEEGTEVRYNREWQNVLRSYLPSGNTSTSDTSNLVNKKKDEIVHRTNTTPVESGIVKKSNIRKTNEQIGNKKDIVFKIIQNTDENKKRLQTLRQTINNPEENTKTQIGRALGETDTYQPIGDGIYLMRSIPKINTSKGKVKTITAKLSDTSKSLGNILGSLDKEDEELIDGGNVHDGNSQSLALENDLKTSSEVFPHNQFQTSDENIEGVQPKEINMISDIQNNLNNEDKITDEHLKTEAASAHVNSFLQTDTNQEGLSGIAKAVQESDKEFIKNNPLAIDPNNNKEETKDSDDTKKFFKTIDPDDVDVPTIPMYKKDLTVIRPDEKQQKTSEAYKLLAAVNKADNSIQNFAQVKENTFNVDSNLDQRAKDIVNFAAQEDAQIMVGGSRSHKSKRRRRKRHKRRDYKKALNTEKLLNVLKSNTEAAEKQVETIEDEVHKNVQKKKGKTSDSTDEPDTGFFMADENDMANMNKKTEDFVSKTVNASLVDIIEPSKKDSTDMENTANNTNDQVVEALNTLTPNDNPAPPQASKKAGNKYHRKRLVRKHGHHSVKHKTHQPQLDNDDKALIDALNKTGMRRVNRHHSGTVWKVRSAAKSKAGRNQGVQIDLYISPSKLKNKHSKEHKTPKTNIQPAGSFMINPSDTASASPSQGLADVEDVSLSEVANNQEKQMFRDAGNEFNDEKASPGILQTSSHLEGNEAKQGSDISIQDAINSEELKTAMKESDLKGLNDIKKELDIQDAKNTVDFFNQPNGAKSLSHHLETNSIGEISQQIKEAETASIDELKAEGKNVQDPQKVKIILHIPEAIGKHHDENTQQAINNLAQQAKAFLNVDGSMSSNREVEKKKSNNQFDDATLAAAKKIEEFIKQEAAKETEEDEQNKMEDKKEATEEKSDDENSEKILSALLKASNSLQTHYNNVTSNAYKPAAINSDSSKSIGQLPTTTQLQAQLQSQLQSQLQAQQNNLDLQNDIKQMETSPVNPNPRPTLKVMENFIKTTHEQALSKETLRGTDAVLPAFAAANDNHLPSTLRINGGKVIGGNVRGGTIIGGIVSGGDVAGGEIRGGTIHGGTFKNGLFIDGDMENGVVEGGKIRGGKILGGDIKSGTIDGGVVKGGIVEGGHLVNGTVEGGDFKGGEIQGGRLLAGEMDGGVLKNGTINGGTLKGGVIESGSLDGGIMLSGTLRGGVVKSGVIKGGIIDKGVIVQDAEIGPGVEIHDGIVKGGRITVNSLPQPVTGATEGYFNPPVPETMHTDENRSNIMYTLQVLPKPTDTFKTSNVKNVTDAPLKVIGDQQDNTSLTDIPVVKVISDDILEKTNKSSTKNTSTNLLESLDKMNGNDIETHLSHLASEQKEKTPEIEQKKPDPEVNKPKKVVNLKAHVTAHRPEMNLKPQKKPTVSGERKMNVNQDNMKIQALLNQLQTSQKLREEEKQQQQATARMYAQVAKIRNEQSALAEDKPVAHWELSKSKNSVIKGDPGSKLRISGGVRIHNGHAILDGVNGYMDAGDYQGECFSDPEVCENGFTIQMTVKIYRDSVFNTSRLFLIDSGAWSKDSRGISIYVSDGRIGGVVVTRDQSWCIHKILEPYIEKWMTLTVTWRKDKGLLLYINCDLFDQSLTHSSSECDQCTSKGGCHKTDVATRLMFGRPNKGPHFKVIHMAVGEISLFEKYSDKDEIKQICGSKESSSSFSQSAVASIVQQPSQSLAHNSVAFIKSKPHVDDVYSWPTPSTLKSLHSKDSVVKVVTDNAGPWPTPARLAPPVARMQPTERPHSLVDPNTDRRSSVQDAHLDGGYSSWQEWSPCSQACGPGKQISVRYCTNPPPKTGGQECYHLGPPRKFRSCIGEECSDHGHRLTSGTKKSSVPNDDGHVEPMIIVNGQQKSLQELETAFEQLKHR